MTDNAIQNIKCERINKAFIDSNIWENIWSEEAKPLDIITIDSRVYLITGIEGKGYNEVRDVFEYNAKLKACFFDEERIVIFYMNLKVDRLVIKKS